MMEYYANDLITVKQLPIIEQMLDKLSMKIEEKISSCISLVPTNSDNELKLLKNSRAELNKDFTELENRRKFVKSEIMKPYNDFEEIYKSKISDKFKEADSILKSKVSEIESKIKSEKEEKIKSYFNEYKESLGLNEIEFNDIDLKINLSGSIKSYNEKVKDFLDKVKSDFEVINTSKDENTRYELIIEYKKDFNLNNAVLSVDKKNIEITRLKQQENYCNDEIIKSPETEEDLKIYEMYFSVKGTKSQLKKLKEYLIQNKLI